MSAPKTYPRVPALCNICGTQRDAAWKTIDGTARLTCATCGVRTTHALVAPEGWDYREHNNRESQTASELQQLIQYIESHGVCILWEDHPEGGTAEVRRYIEPIPMGDGREYLDFIQVARHLLAEERIDALRWGWKALLPSPSWDRCTPLTDSCSDTFVGLYKNGARR